jgi:hypothetical protein
MLATRGLVAGCVSQQIVLPVSDSDMPGPSPPPPLLQCNRGAPNALATCFLLIAVAILVARKLAQYDGGKRVPATVSAIADSIRWAEQIMEEIDRRHPMTPTQQQPTR